MVINGEKEGRLSRKGLVRDCGHFTDLSTAQAGSEEKGVWAGDALSVPEVGACLVYSRDGKRSVRPQQREPGLEGQVRREMQGTGGYKPPYPVVEFWVFP